MNDQISSDTYQNLVRASHFLHTATVLAGESCDADLKLCRALNGAIALLADTSRILVENSLREMQPRD